MTSKKLSALVATATVALSGLVPAVGQATAVSTGRHKVTEKAYVYVEAGRRWSGTMFAGSTFKVERLSKSGRWAYGMAYGHVNRHVWIDADVLRRTARSTTPAAR